MRIVNGFGIALLSRRAPPRLAPFGGFVMTFATVKYEVDEELYVHPILPMVIRWPEFVRI